MKKVITRATPGRFQISVKQLISPLVSVAHDQVCESDFVKAGAVNVTL